MLYYKNMKYCMFPFTQLNLTSYELYPCCRSWVKNNGEGFKGSVHKASEFWISDIMQIFRRSIADGSYKHCSDTCSMLNSRDTSIMMKTIEEIKESYDTELSTEIIRFINDRDSFKIYPLEVGLLYDQSCNLACKTCRKDIIQSTNTRYQILQESRYIDYIRNATTLYISGDGDPFASQYYFSLLQSDLTQMAPKLERINLRTNGILFTKTNWEKIHIKNRSMIKSVSISIDASSPETYLNQRGGDFFILCDNLEFISNLRKTKYLESLDTSYTITAYNYHEMDEFIKFADSYKFDHIYYNIMDDWKRGYSPNQIGITKNDDVYQKFIKKSEQTRKLALLYPHIHIEMLY